MATGGAVEEGGPRGRPRLATPAPLPARAEAADGGREKPGWAQVVRNMAGKKGEFREPRRPGEDGGGAGEGAPGAEEPAGEAGEAGEAAARRKAGPGGGRFLVRICFQGAGAALPTRDFVVGSLLLRSLGMRPGDIFAVIQVPGSREFDVSFRSADTLALFLRNYEQKRGREGCWDDFVVLGRGRPGLKTLFILFRNETVDVEDIVTWLKRHCDVLAVPVKVTDRFGIWTGEYKCEVELRQGEGGVRHLPGAFFLGAERGYSWYKGQPKTCFRCGSRTHMSGSCTQDRCFRCGEQGHLSPRCRRGIVCNLCGESGHAFAQCPKAVHNAAAAQPAGVAGH